MVAGREDLGLDALNNVHQGHRNLEAVCNGTLQSLVILP
jgi:hypothetical protein